ncbi:hypothetical protein A4R35_00775 [Thermogemmatispora tikiterensis]|uniref:Uncharacterized protein n=1 Tax=Thermogemmatispora tikiterensis TaxID=1825093 RepID=A0A328VID1_9CHLR|nr:hypothetical protein A4R35_00775 [Thermogemmatispora tikiterensis]
MGTRSTAQGKRVPDPDQLVARIALDEQRKQVEPGVFEGRYKERLSVKPSPLCPLSPIGAAGGEQPMPRELSNRCPGRAVPTSWRGAAIASL